MGINRTALRVRWGGPQCVETGEELRYDPGVWHSCTSVAAKVPAMVKTLSITRTFLAMLYEIVVVGLNGLG